MKNWKNWLKAAGIRAVKTMVFSASMLAGILSLLTSVAGLPECEK